ncbi:MAG: hypothetical protein NT179_03355 [Nitrospirae bacterium]|nr:hypothetical protein [Nitrospirota bacterium]
MSLVMVAKKSARGLFILLALGGLSQGACARMPYTTTVVHEEQRLSVMLQREITLAGYMHPVQITPQQVAAILRGFSLREQQRLPLRWFAEEALPKKLFRDDELQVLAPQLADALRKAGPEERVYFELFAPGMNPRYRRDVTGGWVAVHGQLLHLTIDYFHVQQPVTQSDPYDYNYPTPWTPEKTYLLYFEPGRFYVMDPTIDRRGVDFLTFLKTIPSP